MQMPVESQNLYMIYLMIRTLRRKGKKIHCGKYENVETGFRRGQFDLQDNHG